MSRKPGSSLVVRPFIPPPPPPPPPEGDGEGEGEGEGAPVGTELIAIFFLAQSSVFFFGKTDFFLAITELRVS